LRFLRKILTIAQPIFPKKMLTVFSWVNCFSFLDNSRDSARVNAFQITWHWSSRRGCWHGDGWL